MSPTQQTDGQVQELLQEWTAQVRGRSRDNERKLDGLASYLISPSIHGLDFETDLLPIGEVTHIVMSRRFYRDTQNQARMRLRLMGYKAGLTPEGVVEVGGPSRVAFGYDFRYEPREDAAPGGIILSTRKVNTIRAGLVLDDALQEAGDQQMWSRRPILPMFLAAFRASDVPRVMDTPAGRRLVLEMCLPQYQGPAFPSTMSPGGVITSIVQDTVLGLILVEFNSGEVVELPLCSRLRPFVKEGVEIARGAVIADLIPRGAYGTWTQLQKAISGDPALVERVLFQAQHEAVAGKDVHRGNYVLREVHLCSPEQVSSSEQVYEKFDIGPDQRPPVQVCIEHGLKSLDSSVQVDMTAVRPGWARKLG